MTLKRAMLFLAIVLAAALTIRGWSVISFAQETSATDPANNDELRQAGNVKTCLKASWNSFSEEKGSKRTQTIHLQGQCMSRSGCTCIKYQHPNGAVAADQDGNLDSAFCEETAYAGSNFDDVLGASDLLAKKTDPEEKVSRKSMAKTDAEKRAIDLGNRCRKAVREANDPVLGAVPVGPSTCRIIKNNLQNNTVPDFGNQVLGVGDTAGLIPYGPVDIIVEEETYKHSPLEFSAVGEIAPDVTVSDLGAGGEIADGNNSTQKLGTFEFMAEALNVNVEDIATNCTAISWDPYGRIFDAESLEPIAEVEVELLDGVSKDPIEMSFNLPYDFTGNDGLYNIQVEKEGKYSLTVDPLTQHQFVSTPKLNPLWNKIYSDLYLPNEVFTETLGVATHHDIPLQSAGKPYRGAISVVVPGTLKSEQMNDKVVFTGRVTFPMAKVCLVDEATNNQVGSCVNANNVGRFVIGMAKSSLPSSRIYIATEKVDLTNPELYKKERPLETLNIYSSPFTKIKKNYYYEPILSLIEGYARDPGGKIIPNAKIQVRLKVNKSLFYETKADDSGFFTIYAKNLPYFEYYLEFIDPSSGNRVTQTTSEFVSSNKDYLNSSKVNLMSAEKGKQSVINQQTDKSGRVSSLGSSETNQNGQIRNATNPIKMELLIIVFILAVLVIGAVGIAIYIKRQNKFVS
ncbi:MAG: carboxypeptidase-like regulatory domain-containing protein [Patescibacteria group bacterium]